MFFIKFFIFVFVLFLNISLVAETNAPLLRSLVKSISVGDEQIQKEDRSDDVIVRSIRVTGNQIISSQQILKGVNLKMGDVFSQIKLDISLKNVKSMGYFEQVRSAVNQEKQQIDIVVEVKENPLVPTVNIIGNTIYKTQALNALMLSKAGALLSLSNIRHDIKAINQHYSQAGYSKAKVYRVVTPEKSGDPLTIYVSEGIIESIVLTGNIKTRDYVILRELDIKPGDAINDEDLKKNIRRVFNLNYFNNVYPHFVPTSDPDKYVLQLNIEERETSGSFTFGGGYSPTGGFSLFSDLFWDNLFGTGQTILLKANFGVGTIDGQSNNRSTYQFKYHNPWMWDERKSFTFRTWRTNGNLSSFNPLSGGFALRDELRRGFDVAIGIPHTYELGTSHKVKYEHVQLNDVNRSYDIYSYTLGLSDDTRDVRFNPREGHYNTFYIEQGFKLGSQSLEFTQFDVAFRKFFPTFKKQTIALRAEYGYIRSTQIDDRDLFRSQVYYIGGSNTVRGYDDFSPFAWGNVKSIYSAEYRFLLTNRFQIVAFVDTGYATYDKSAIFDYRNYKLGKGIGMRFNVPPMGPIRLDFAFDEDGEMHIHFNIGHAF